MNLNRIIDYYVKWRFIQVYNRILKFYYSYYLKNGYAIFKEEIEVQEWASNPQTRLSKPIYREHPWIESPVELILKRYCGFWCEKINLNLRNPNLFFDIKNILLDEISIIDKEMELHKLTHKTIVVRWVEFRWFESTFGIPLHKVQKYMVLQDKAYLSTSLWLYYKGKYDTEQRDFSKNILFLLEVPPGIYGICIPKEISNRDEYELLIAKGQHIKIKDICYRLHHSAIIVGEILI